MEQNENNFIEFTNEKYGTIKIYIPHITLEKMMTNEPQNIINENTTIIVKKRLVVLKVLSKRKLINHLRRGVKYHVFH